MSTLFQNVYSHEQISNTILNQLIDCHRQVKFSKGDVFLSTGEIARSYLILEHGLMRTYVYDFDGNEITTSFIAPHQLVIEVSSMFQQTPAMENFECLSECTAWEMSHDHFQQFFHQYNGVREWGRDWLTAQLILNKKRSIELITLSAKERYLNLIKRNPSVAQFAPLKQIASYLGITDTSLSRIRKEIARS